MIRYFAALALLCALLGCSPATPNLNWVMPTTGSTLSGVVNLQVSALQEPYPVNVVFFADGLPIAKAYPEDGEYHAQWDTSALNKTTVTLSAKPFAGQAVEASVSLAGTLP